MEMGRMKRMKHNGEKKRGREGNGKTAKEKGE